MLVVSLALAARLTKCKRPFFRVRVPKGDSWSQAFPGESVVTWNKNHDVPQRHDSHCEESLGKIDAKDFELFRNESVNESVDYFGTIAHELFSESVYRWRDYKLVGCCKLSLYANDSCDEHAGLFSAMIEMTCHFHYVFGLW